MKLTLRRSLDGGRKAVFQVKPESSRQGRIAPALSDLILGHTIEALVLLNLPQNEPYSR